MGRRALDRRCISGGGDPVSGAGIRTSDRCSTAKRSGWARCADIRGSGNHHLGTTAGRWIGSVAPAERGTGHPSRSLRRGSRASGCICVVAIWKGPPSGGPELRRLHRILGRKTIQDSFALYRNRLHEDRSGDCVMTEQSWQAYTLAMLMFRLSPGIVHLLMERPDCCHLLISGSSDEEDG